VFFVTDGRANPVDQLEALKAWIEAQGAELARIVCVVDCQLAERHPALRAWFDACVHFADVVLLNRREGVANKWMSDFQARFKSQFMPCLFEMVKAGRVKNPGLVLDPQARRMSHVFDEEQDWIFTNAEGDEVEEDEETEGDEEVEAKPEEDPYFERLNGGRRVKELPDIAAFLDGAR
jgi:G3E family GTPase